MKKKILSVRLAAIVAVLLAFFALGVTAMAEEPLYQFEIFMSEDGTSKYSTTREGSKTFLGTQESAYQYYAPVITGEKWLVKGTGFSETVYTFTENDLKLTTADFFQKYFGDSTEVQMVAAAEVTVYLSNVPSPKTFYVPLGETINDFVTKVNKQVDDLKLDGIWALSGEYYYSDANVSNQLVDTTSQAELPAGGCVISDVYYDARVFSFVAWENASDGYPFLSAYVNGYELFKRIVVSEAKDELLSSQWLIDGTIYSNAPIGFEIADFDKTIAQVFAEKFGEDVTNVRLYKALPISIMQGDGAPHSAYVDPNKATLATVFEQAAQDGYTRNSSTYRVTVLTADGKVELGRFYYTYEVSLSNIMNTSGEGAGVLLSKAEGIVLEPVTAILFSWPDGVGESSIDAGAWEAGTPIETVIQYIHDTYKNDEYYQDIYEAFKALGNVRWTDSSSDGTTAYDTVKLATGGAAVTLVPYAEPKVALKLYVGGTTETYYLGYDQKFSELELGFLFKDWDVWVTDPLLLKSGKLSAEQATELSPDMTGADLAGRANEYWACYDISFHGFGESVPVYAAISQDIKTLYQENDGVGDLDRSSLLAPIKTAEPEGTDYNWYCDTGLYSSSIVGFGDCYPITEKTVSIYRGDELIFGPKKYPSHTLVGYEIGYEANLSDLAFGDDVYDAWNTEKTLDALSSEETIVLHTVTYVKFQFSSPEATMIIGNTNSSKPVSELRDKLEAWLERLISNASTEEAAENYRKRLEVFQGASGWAASVNGQFVTNDKGELVPVTELPTEGEVMLYPLNTITFKADGKVVDTLYYVGGSKPEGFREPDVPAKTGYYAKWESYSFDDAKDIVVEALYTAKTYRVQFDANGGVGAMSLQIHSWDGKRALTSNAFTREGYSFIGWNTKADGSGVSYADGEVVSNLSLVGGALLYAQWEKVIVPPKVFTVTFMADGAFVDSVSFTEGDTALSFEPDVPEKVGYTGAWASYTLGSEDITVQAVYAVNSYVIAFNANDGDGTMTNLIATYNDFAALPENTFTYLGRKFLGWNSKADGSGASFADGAQVINLTSEGLITLFAQWGEEDSSTESTPESTTAETTTAEAPAEKNNTGLIIGLCVAAAISIAGGVAGYLTYQKKKNS